MRKTPQEKKALSYAKDRRNAYGESRANSRFSIRKNKTFPKRAYRHRIAQILNSEIDELNQENLETVDNEVKSFRRSNWKKVPDIPLEDWVRGRLEYRKRMFRAKIERRLKRQNKIED
jgi:hypothetical protein